MASLPTSSLFVSTTDHRTTLQPLLSKNFSKRGMICTKLGATRVPVFRNTDYDFVNELTLIFTFTVRRDAG